MGSLVVESQRQGDHSGVPQRIEPGTTAVAVKSCLPWAGLAATAVSQQAERECGPLYQAQPLSSPLGSYLHRPIVMSEMNGSGYHLETAGGSA